MSVTLSFLGAAEGVTGSRHLLNIDGRHILVDCGLFQGRRKESRERNHNFPIDARKVEAVVLTHAHIDHSGALPMLRKRGFEGPIYCTKATADLTKVLLRDSGHIQEKDAEYLNRRAIRDARKAGQTAPKPEFEALYTSQDAELCDSQFRGLDYHQSTKIADGVHLSLTDQGHILGSSAALITIETPGRPALKIVFSGDRGRGRMPILRDPEPYPDCDWLLTESTYGNRVHDPIADMPSQLLTVVDEVLKAKGKLIIPAFSVGRTQNIVYYLAELIHSGQLPSIPVYIDSPLSRRATHVYMVHPECFDAETLRALMTQESYFDFVRYTESVEESIELNHKPGPMIILSASGMCESGRILHHLKHNLGHARNTILIVGWMGEHTLGRKLKEKAKSVKIYGQEYSVKARIRTMNGLSAHGDQQDILHSVAHLKERLKGLILIHGERSQSEVLKAKLEEEGHKKVQIAELFSTITLAD